MSSMKLEAILEERDITQFFEDAKIRAKLSACQSAPQLKDESLAASHRQQGNVSFRAGRYMAALQQYGLAVFSAVTADTLSGALANRSAALYHLQRYQDSLQDMASALEAGYPTDRHHKLHVRRSRCHLALGRADRARAALAEYKAAVDSMKLGPAEKMTSEADALLADIERVAATDGDQRHSLGAASGDDEESSTPKPTVEGGGGSLVGASSCLRVRQTQQKGRHVVTTRAVQKGAVLFAEEPYVCVLLSERRLDHCHHCIRYTHSLLPCRRCRDVGFCSAACRDAAGAIYHPFECGQAEFLEAFGIGRFAVRVVLTAGWRRLEALRGQLPADGSSCDAASCSCHRTAGDRYLAVFHLVHHLAESHPEDAYHYGRAAATLAVFLAERTAFFGTGGGPPPESAIRWTAAVLLRHILQLVCNAHAATKLVPLPCDDGGGGVIQLSEQRIATAIYPSASYMNHACDPNIINSFWGSTLVARSVKPLSPGAEVFHCYGPHFAREPPAQRRSQLLEQYHFSCDCDHCSRPELANHLELLNSPRCRDCGDGTLPAEDDSSGERRRCLACRRLHRYGDRLARLQAIETEAEQVATLGDGPGGRQALSRLDALLDEAGSVARPTHETLYILHDLRAKLCTQLGEPVLALGSLRPNLVSVEARYGGDSVELGNLLLTATDVLLLACRAAGTGERHRELSDELRREAGRGLAIFSIHYGEWSPAYRNLRRKLAPV